MLLYNNINRNQQVSENMTTFNEMANKEKDSLKSRKLNIVSLTKKEFKALKMSEKLTLALCELANVSKKEGNANQTYFLEDRNLITRHFDEEKNNNNTPYLRAKITDLGLSVIKFHEENGYPTPKKRIKKTQ